MNEWIAVKDRLPDRAIGGAENWHTEPIIVCAYGNYCNEGWEHYEYEILTGIFIKFEDELCFEPDRWTLFLPEEGDFLPLDDEFKFHDEKDACMFYVNEESDETEYHDRFIQILAWMPFPEPYKEVKHEDIL